MQHVISPTFARKAAFVCLALASRELSLLPPGRGESQSRIARWSEKMIKGATEVTALLGLAVSGVAGMHLRKESGLTMPPGKVAGSTRAIRETGEEKAANRQRKNRQLALLKRSGLFDGEACGAVIERALTLHDLRRAYKLVHDVYLGTGYIDPEPAGLRLRIFETTSDTATFVAKIEGKVVAVLSIVGDSSELGLPSDSAFRSELDVLRARKLRLCEATNQAVSAGYRKSSVPTELMRCAVAHMTKAGYDEVIATVSPSHNAFYELLGFREIGSERSYSDKIHDPVVALSMDINRYRRESDHSSDAEDFVHDFMAAGNHFLPRVEDWQKQARRHFLNADLLQGLFVSERNFVGECTPAELRILHQRWGKELFGAVTDDLFVPPCEEVTPKRLRSDQPQKAPRKRAGRRGVLMRQFARLRRVGGSASFVFRQKLRKSVH